MGQTETRVPKWFKTTVRFSRGGVLVLVTIAANALLSDESRLDFATILATLSTQYGVQAQARGIAWQENVTKLGGLTVQEQLTAVNKFFNRRVRWKTDLEIYGAEDFWATPAETLGRGTGDCEDFTIAKYATLRHLGVPAEQLRLTYVQLKVTNTRSQAHMVLAWYPSPNTTPLILDNANPRILPASQRRDLQPIFSFNSEELWLGNSRASTSASPSSRISQWRQMIARSEREGIVL
jgi:predicted transglutaminase-like cysteine proteinase